MTRVLIIYTDGACDPNPGLGGWSFIAYEGAAEVHSDSGAEPEATNNLMEMVALLRAIEWAPADAAVQVLSDSMYAVQGCVTWRHGWKKRGWSRPHGARLANREVWMAIDAAIERKPKLRIQWCRGHDGNARNEAADRLAVEARLSLVENPQPGRKKHDQLRERTKP